MLSFFPRDVLDKIWDLIGSVSEDSPTDFCGECGKGWRNGLKLNLVY